MPDHISHTIVLLLLSFLVLSSSAFPKDQVLFPGQRVRVDYESTFRWFIFLTAKEVRKEVGTLISLNADSVVISTNQPDSETKVISISTVKNIYYSDGKKRRWLKGMAIGSAVSLFFLAMASGDPISEEEQGWAYRKPILFLGVFVGGPIAVGGIIGWFHNWDRWRKVDRREWPVDIEITRQQGSLQLGLSFRF